MASQILLLLVSTFLGCLAGTISGLAPGIHLNTLAVFALSAYYAYRPDPLCSAAFIIGMSVMHSVSDFVPSIFLGAPNPDNVLTVLPAHRMLFAGKGCEALALSVAGVLSGTALMLVFMPLILLAVPLAYGAIKDRMILVILPVLLYVFLKCGNTAKSFFIFLLSGIFGIAILNSGLINANFILFPAFTGIFGISTMLLSVETASELPKQDTKFSVGWRETLLGGFAGFLGGMFAGTMPALGSSQSASLMQGLLGTSGESKERTFIISTGAIGTVGMIFSIIAIYLIGNPRSGSGIVIDKMMSLAGSSAGIDFGTMMVFVGLSALSCGIASVFTMAVGRKAARLVELVDYRKTVLSVIVLLVLMVAFMTGVSGLVILATGTAIGLLTQGLGVNKSFAMGVLMLQTILYFAGLNWIVLKMFV